MVLCGVLMSFNLVAQIHHFEDDKSLNTCRKFFAKTDFKMTCLCFTNLLDSLGRTKSVDPSSFYVNYIRLRKIEAAYYKENRDSLLIEIYNYQKTISSDKVEMQFLKDLSQIYRGMIIQKDSTQKSKEIYLSFINKYRNVEDTYEDLSKVFNQIGILHFHILKDDDRSLMYLDSSKIFIYKMEKPNYDRAVIALANSAQPFFRKGEFNRALDSLKVGLKLASKHMHKEHSTYNYLLANLGAINSKIGNHNEAIKYNRESIRIKEDLYGKFSEKSISQYFNIAGSYFDLNQYESSLAVLDTALQIEKKYNNNPLIISKIYIRMANSTLDRLERFELEKKALKLALTVDNGMNDAVYSLYNNLGVSHVNFGNLEQALNYYLKSIEIKTKLNPLAKSDLYSNYSNLSSLYAKMKDFKLSLEYMEKAIDNIIQFRGDDSPILIGQYNKLGKSFYNLNEFVKAEYYIQKSMDLCEKHYSKDHLFYGESLFYQSECSFARGAYSKTLQQSLKAHEIYTKVKGRDHKFTSACLLVVAKSYLALGNRDQWDRLSNQYLLDAGFVLKNDQYSYQNIPEYKLWTAANAYWELYLENIEQSKRDTTYVVSEAETTMAIELISKLKKLHFFESFEKDFQTKTRVISDLSLEFWFNKYEATKDEKYIGKIYQLLEESRLISINRRILSGQDSAIIPDSIISKEKKIIAQYEVAYEQFQKQSAADQKDSLAYEAISASLFDIQLKREIFIDDLKSSYPDYFNARYSQQMPGLSSLQDQLKNENQTLVYYHWTKEKTYKLSISPNKQNIHQIVTKDIEEILIDYLPLISDVINDEWHYAEIKQKFVKNSHALYELLIDDSDLTTEEIIVIPDGPLVQLPFDILIKNESNGPYQSMDYLLNEHCFSYATSTLQIGAHGVTDNPYYVGFAPTYAGVDKLASVSRGDGKFRNLVNNRSEIEKVSPIFRSEVYLDSSATKANFLNHIEKADIIHLAMHAFVTEKTYGESFLKFYDDSDMIDSELSVREISRLNIQTDLLVLSACNTNVGTTNYGEGILGLAKSFQMAGSSNMIISNWLVDDFSGTNLMTLFFQKLASGTNKSQALVAAKRSYLQDANDVLAHPFYWAGYNYYGAPSQSFSIENKKNWAKYSVIFILFFIIMYYFYKLFIKIS